jgi:hypothetical protein
MPSDLARLVIVCTSSAHAGLNKKSCRECSECAKITNIGVRPINRLVGAGNRVGGISRLLKRSD